MNRNRATLWTVGLGAVCAIAAAGIGLSHVPTPIQPGSAWHPPALPVATVQIEPQSSYLLRRGYAGRVQARRASVLGFESSGRLARVHGEEGDSIAQGALLAELDTERLQAKRAELSAALAEAQANLSLADATLRRMRGIVEKGGVSRQDLDEAHEGQRAAQATVELAAQRIASIEVELAKARLYAPFAGTLIARLADEGRVLDTGEPVLHLQEDSAPEIRIGVAGRAVEQLEPGAIYDLQWHDRRVAARLRALLPMRAATARTVDALFDPLHDQPRPLPGDIVTLHLTTRIDEPGAWLPITAITEGERGLWSLYVAEPAPDSPAALGATHRVTRRTVDVIHQESERVFVRGALTAQDRIVSTGLQRIVPGQWVRPLDTLLAMEALGPVHTTRYAALLPQNASGKARGEKFSEPK